MYEDYKGSVVIDTIDHITTIEDYARNKGIDTDKFDIVSIEIGGYRENLVCKFICKNKEDGEIEEFKIEPYDLVFKEFFKTTKIVIENN